jgi:hypothetical protein
MPLNLTPLREMKGKILTAVAEEAAASILAPAQERIPVDEAIAQHSGRVVRDGDRIVVSFGRDDDGTADHAPCNTYIERLEEDMEMVHPHGGQAKFLSTSADEAQSGFAERVARRVKI